jgi:hypothetical protein
MVIKHNSSAETVISKKINAMLPEYHSFETVVKQNICRFNISVDNSWVACIYRTEITPRDRKIEREADREIVIDLQSSCKYASPLVDPRAILSLVGQSMVGRPLPTNLTTISNYQD